MTAPQRLLLSALASACLGLGILAYSERMGRLAAEDRLRTAQDENTRLTSAQVAAPTVLPVPDPEPGPGPGPADMTPPANPETASVDVRNGPPGMRQSASELAAMMESPEIQQLMNLRARGGLDARYAGLFKMLGLPADQLERLQQLLVDKQNTARDVFAAMRSQGLAPNRENREQTRSLIENANAEIDTQIRAAIGDTAFAQYQNYEQTQPQRALVERVQQRLSYSGAPLTEQQAASLVNILAQNTTTPVSTSGIRVNGPRSASGGVAITDTVIAQAQTVLSSSQLIALQQLQQEQEAQAQLIRRSRRNQAPGSR